MAWDAVVPEVPLVRGGSSCAAPSAPLLGELAAKPTEGSPGSREYQLGKERAGLRLHLATLCKGSWRAATEGLSTDLLKTGV